MKLLYVGSECTPFASTGGLGEVISSLPTAVKKDNPEYDVRTVMPLYSQISSVYRDKMKFLFSFTVHLAWRELYCGVFTLTNDGVVYYFLDNEYYFKRNKLYGEYDDGERFAFFSMAVLSMLEHLSYVPDVIHANDWQSALIPVYLKTIFRQYNIKTVYTIHNIDYQGIFSHAIIGDVFSLPQSAFSLMDYEGCINLTKAAIECADRFTTVSPRYAEEIKTPYFGTSLHSFIGENSYKLSGIVNGIDYKEYEPKYDKLIASKFSKTNPSGKAICKNEIFSLIGMQPTDAPLIVMISRLASHKGFDLVECVFDEIMKNDVRFVILGTGEQKYESFFADAQRRYPDKVRAILKFDRVLAKKLYAGADIFLMPSKSEPCGLAQMMACRYGTIPIVHEVGGLYDTIKPFDHTKCTGNGFTFATYNAHDMLDAIRRTVGAYNDKKIWNKVIRNAMGSDFSWSCSAKKYTELYSCTL